MNNLQETWVYLSASPLFHLTLTLLAFQAANWIYHRSGRLPIFNPVLLAVIAVVTLLMATNTSYATYFEGAQFVHFLLGPATVALAIPLYKQFHLIRNSAIAIGASLLSGGAVAVVTAVGLAWVFGGTGSVLASLAPKSVTAPVAMGIAEEIGGVPSLTAAMVLGTGIIGAMFGPAVLRLVGVTESRATGVAIGTVSHGIGTARLLQDDETAAAFSGLAMGMNALATALLLPILWGLSVKLGF